MQLHVGQLLIEAGWGDITLAFSKLAEVFKYNSIHLNFTFQRLSNSNNNDSFLIDGLWKVKVRYVL